MMSSSIAIVTPTYAKRVHKFLPENMSIRMNAVSNRDIMNKFYTAPPSSKEKKEEVPSTPTTSSSAVDVVDLTEEETTSIDDSEPALSSRCDSSTCYAVIRNIPSPMHSKNLRRFFAEYTDNDRFQCFHYRHRPELQGESTSIENAKKSATTCCVVSFPNSQIRSDFIKDFHGSHWMNDEGMEMPRRCFVSALKVVSASSPSSSTSLSESDLASLIELRPPGEMPKGNVGTPTQFFFEQIRLCRLPASLIPRLGLKATRRKRKYDSRPFQYPEGIHVGDGRPTQTMAYEEKSAPGEDENRRDRTMREQMEDVLNMKDKPTPSDPTDKVMQEDYGVDNDMGADDDDDQCEEWERHEALRDDVHEQDRAKPRKYEEEQEVTWEKGGPGLVWHTDKNYWDEREKGTDCDWLWTDDWDVDYSVYYEGKSAGTKDARDAVEMREDEERRSGKLVESVFTKKIEKTQPAMRKRRYSGSDKIDVEKYTRGIGSRLLGKMGWKPGKGLGKDEQGRPKAVAEHMEEEGQTSREKQGLGYRGEKMQRTGFIKAAERHQIASCFDEATDKGTSSNRLIDREDQKAILFRSSEPTKMKYR